MKKVVGETLGHRVLSSKGSKAVRVHLDFEVPVHYKHNSLYINRKMFYWPIVFNTPFYSHLKPDTPDKKKQYK